MQIANTKFILLNSIRRCVCISALPLSKEWALIKTHSKGILVTTLLDRPVDPISFWLAVTIDHLNEVPTTAKVIRVLKMSKTLVHLPPLLCLGNETNPEKRKNISSRLIHTHTTHYTQGKFHTVTHTHTM